MANKSNNITLCCQILPATDFSQHPNGESFRIGELYICVGRPASIQPIGQIDAALCHLAVAMMEKTRKIKYQKATHKGEERIVLDIPYEEQIMEKVKMIPGRKWSQIKKCWHVPNNQESMRYINRLIQLYDQAADSRDIALTPKVLEKKPSGNDMPKAGTSEESQNIKHEAVGEKIYLTITPKKLLGHNFSKTTEIYTHAIME